MPCPWSRGREKHSRKAKGTAGNISGPFISQKYFSLSSASQQETEKEKQEQISNRLIHEFTASNVHPSSDSLLLYAVWFLDSKLCTLSISPEYALLMNTEALNISVLAGEPAYLHCMVPITHLFCSSSSWADLFWRSMLRSCSVRCWRWAESRWACSWTHTHTPHLLASW